MSNINIEAITKIATEAALAAVQAALTANTPAVVAPTAVEPTAVEHWVACCATTFVGDTKADAVAMHVRYHDQQVAKRKAAKAAADRPLCKKSRLDFIAAAAAEGVPLAHPNGVRFSCREIAEACVAWGYAPKGFVIGDGYRALVS